MASVASRRSPGKHGVPPIRSCLGIIFFLLLSIVFPNIWTPAAESVCNVQKAQAVRGGRALLDHFGIREVFQGNRWCKLRVWGLACIGCAYSQEDIQVTTRL